MSLTIFPYDCFITEKIFTLKDLDTSPLDVIKTLKDSESIFKKNAELIKKFIDDNKLNNSTVNNDNKKIEELSKLFIKIKDSTKEYFTDI